MSSLFSPSLPCGSLGELSGTRRGVKERGRREVRCNSFVGGLASFLSRPSFSQVGACVSLFVPKPVRRVLLFFCFLRCQKWKLMDKIPFPIDCSTEKQKRPLSPR